MLALGCQTWGVESPWGHLNRYISITSTSNLTQTVVSLMRRYWHKVPNLNIEKIKSPEFVRWLFMLLLLAGLLAAVFWVVPFEDVLAALKSADLLLVGLSVLTLFPLFYFDAQQIKIMAHKQGLKWSVHTIFRINLAVLFYQLFVPGTLVGSGIRWVRFSKIDNRPAETLAVMVYKRLVDFYITVFLAVGFLVLAQDQINQNSALGFGLLTCAIIALWVILPALSTQVTKALNYIQKRAPKNKWLRKILGGLIKATTGFADYRDLQVRRQVKILLLGIGKQLLGLVGYLIMAQAVKIDITWLDMGWIWSASLLSIYLPINIGLGTSVRDIGTAALLIANGTPATLAIAFSVLLFFQHTVMALLGGLIELIQQIASSKS